MFWTNPHSLRIYRFPSNSADSLNFFLVNLLLVRSHQAEIIVVKHLTQGRNNTTDEGGY